MISFPETFTAALLLIEEEFLFTEILMYSGGHPPSPPGVFLTQQQANKAALKRECDLKKQGYE